LLAQTGQELAYRLPCRSAHQVTNYQYQHYLSFSIG
jgi:hypothetical protein